MHAHMSKLSVPPKCTMGPQRTPQDSVKHTCMYTCPSRSRLDGSVELPYKRWNSAPVGWCRQNGNQSCSWGRCNVNTDRPQLQLHRVLLCRGISQFTLLHYWAGLNMTTIHLCWCLWHHPTGTRLQAVQHSYLIYSWSKLSTSPLPHLNVLWHLKEHHGIL